MSVADQSRPRDSQPQFSWYARHVGPCHRLAGLTLKGTSWLRAVGQSAGKHGRGSTA